MAQNPINVYSGNLCNTNIGVNGFTQTMIDNISDSFELSPNYEEVYITTDSSQDQEFLHDPNINNNYGMTKYKCWIYDGTEDEQTVGYKYIQMYPYTEYYLHEGDYVSFDYYHNGTKVTWLCLALDSSSVYEQVGKIRPCTNEIRFYNANGELIKIPCVFDNKINSEKNITLSNMKYINGITTIYAQINPDSMQLKPNQRLLFGNPSNWTAFRVVSVGINNFMNTIYWDNSSVKVLEITMEASYVNEDADDLVNGIADANSFSIEIYPEVNSISTGESVQLNANVIKNENQVVQDIPVVWESSNDSIATISDSGLLEGISTGSVTITCTMQNNQTVTASLNISVENTVQDLYEVVVVPYSAEGYGILQGNNQSFTCYLYNNGVKQDNEFNFVLNTEANNTSYQFVVNNGNSFSIYNNRMSSYPLYINCTSGEYSLTVEVLLKGAW